MTANTDIVITKSGLWVSPEYPLLDGSPDACIFDSGEKEPYPYGFAKIKCPFKHRYT